MNRGLHHYHKRKRLYKNLEEIPHPNKFKRFIDKIIYFIAILGPIMTVPQVLKIWIGKDATGVSPLSWLSYLVISIFWLMYGVLHKEKPIIFAQIFWLMVHFAVFTGAIIYGKFP